MLLKRARRRARAGAAAFLCAAIGVEEGRTEPFRPGTPEVIGRLRSSHCDIAQTGGRFRKFSIEADKVGATPAVPK